MKQIRFNILLKPIALMLLVTFLIQGCAIYDKYPITVDRAVSQDKVKILFDDGKIIVYKNIYYKDDCMLYGTFTKYDSENYKPSNIEVLIPEDKIVEIYNYNAKESKKKTTVLIVCTSLGGLLIWGIAAFGKSLNEWTR